MSRSTGGTKRISVVGVALLVGLIVAASVTCWWGYASVMHPVSSPASAAPALLGSTPPAPSTPSSPARQEAATLPLPAPGQKLMPVLLATATPSDLPHEKHDIQTVGSGEVAMVGFVMSPALDERWQQTCAQLKQRDGDGAVCDNVLALKWGADPLCDQLLIPSILQDVMGRTGGTLPATLYCQVHPSGTATAGAAG